MLTGVALLIHGPRHGFGFSGEVFIALVVVLIVLIFARVYGGRRRR
jgi:hypothetical protein